MCLIEMVAMLLIGAGCGYAFRGKINKGVKAAGVEAESLAGKAAKKL